MIRSRRWFALATIPALLFLSPMFGQAPQPATKAADEWNLDRKLTISPMPAPVPAMKYSLLPLASDLKEGNAVPIYLRLIHEKSDETRKYWTETPKAWNDKPIDQIPLSAAREFTGQLAPIYRQFDLGSRRRTAEWNYTTDQGDLTAIALPDVQVMRQYVPMLVLRARVALAERNFAAAAQAIETGFAFSRHIAEQPFLIHGLVAVACATQIADAALDFVERPGAPNLYWSLTGLPRPFLDFRPALQFEQRLLELQFPDLADLDRSRSPDQWEALLKHLRTEWRRLAEMEKSDPLAAGINVNDPASAAPNLPAAKAYVAERWGMTSAAVDAMPPARILIQHMVGVSRDLRDDWFKAAYLPYAEARPLIAAAAAKRDATPNTEAERFARLLLPNLNTVLRAQNRIDRRMAALRVIEALRLHAAANGGRLPDRLDQITVVPVPDDPGTGKPFEYRRDGASATLTGRVPDETLATTGLRYTIAVREK